MANSMAFLEPDGAKFYTSAYPEKTYIHATAQRPVLAFDDTADEVCYWTLAAPQSYAPDMVAIVHCVTASDTNTGHDVIFRGELEAITPGVDAVDLDSAESFGSANNSAATAILGTAGYEFTVPITMTNDDGIAAGDLVRFRLTRYATSGSDTVVGDVYVLGVELREAA